MDPIPTGRGTANSGTLTTTINKADLNFGSRPTIIEQDSNSPRQPKNNYT